MSGLATRIDLVRRARSGIQETLRLLLNPTAETVTECAAHLEDAIRWVKHLEDGIDEPGLESPRALRAELSELWRDSLH